MAKLKDLQEGLEEIRKQYGTASVFQANDNFRSNIQSVSTGSFNLNDAIGVGGAPCGRLVMLSGVESSGKSLLALSIIKEAQKDGGIGYYIDGEYTFDPDWTRRLGVDLDKILISQTNNAKDVFELLLGKPKIEGKRLKPIPGILTNEKILKAGLKVVVIDSVDSLSPPMEVSSEVGKPNMALMARFLPPELRRLTPILSQTNVTVIAIMQARQNPGQMYGDALTVSGGRALKHAASLWIDLAVRGSSAITIDGQKDGEKIGHGIRAKIRKNKVAPPFKDAEFTIYFQKGIDIRPEIPQQAVNAGVIKNPSGRTYTYKSALGDFKWNGLTALSDELLQNAALLKEIAVEVKDAKKKENEVRLADTSFKDEEIETLPVMLGETDEFEEVSDEAPVEEVKKASKAKPTEESGSLIDSNSTDDTSIEGNEEEGIESDSEKEKKESDSSEKKNDSNGNKEVDYESMTGAEVKEVAKKMNIPSLYKYQTKNSLIKAIISNKP